MYRDTYLDKLIGQRVRERDMLERATHVPSGKLSASQLGLPVQWQVLKTLATEQEPHDEYTLRKFARGKQIEEWLINEMDGVVDKQKFVEYKGVVGYVDAMVDTAKYDHRLGIMPHEVKSVSNAKFKRVLREGKADMGHKLQAGLYALATKSDYFAVDYVATDDLRVLTFVYQTSDVKKKIEEIIKAYNTQISRRQVPVFKPIEKWNANAKYAQYPKWATLTQAEIDLAMQTYFPKAWDKILQA